MSRLHNLKVWEEFFPDLASGAKPFEVRRDDRGFAVGGLLKLREFCDASRTYSGRAVVRRVSYVLRGGQFGIAPGFVVLGLEAVSTPRLRWLGVDLAAGPDRHVIWSPNADQRRALASLR